MDMVPVDPNVLRLHDEKRSYRRVQIAIEQFINSNALAVELKWETGGYISGASCYSSYWKAIKRMNVGVTCVMRENRVFLIRVEEVAQ